MIMSRMFNYNKLIICLAILIGLSRSAFSADPLDSVKSQSALINDLKDVYRAFNISHAVADQKELINIHLEDGDDYLKKHFKDYIKVCETLKSTPFTNKNLAGQVNIFLTATIQNYNIAISKGIESAAFKHDVKTYQQISDKYYDYLIKAYPMEHFVKMTEEKYWQINDKKNYIKATGYVSYQKLRNTNLKEAMTALDKICKQTSNFQEYSIYQIEYADQYVKDSDKLNDPGNGIAIKKYKEIIDKKQYCIYLYEAWAKWRVVTQQENGLSKTSDIPNDKYDKMRTAVALTILKQINTQPHDDMAINQFLVVATHDIVRRFGQYPYGNQNTVEYHEIFDEDKK